MRTQDKDVKGLGRITRGQVSSSGGVVSGSGFTVSRTGTGVYVITFMQPMKTQPIVNYQTLGGTYGAYINNITANGFTVNTFVSNTAAAGDSPFWFSAQENNQA